MPKIQNKAFFFVQYAIFLNYNNRNFKEREESFHLNALHAQTQSAITYLSITVEVTIWKFLGIKKVKGSSSF